VAGDSQAGYRVRERLASLSAESDAVGRTSSVTGSITLDSDGTTAMLTAGTLTVDTTTIASDEDRRDNRLRTEGLQTDTYPTASFTITQPVEIPASAIEGTPTDVTLIGDLELHGVTKSVSIPAQARLVDGTIQVAGSITFPLADFEIEPPNVGGFILSIADEGALEFAVNFTRT
jgi:polyisoprenoid-binding protein YceI